MIGISLILALAGDQTLYVVLPVLAASGIYPLVRVGVLLSANRFIRLLSNPVVGSWLHGKKRKPFFLFGLLVGACTPVLYVYGITSFWIFLLGRIFWGIAFSLLYISSVTMVMDMTDHRTHGWGSGLLQVFYFSGLAITPLLGGLLNDWIGFKAALLISAGLGGLAFILSWIFIEEEPTIVIQTQTDATISAVKTGWDIPQIKEKIKLLFSGIHRGIGCLILYLYAQCLHQ